VSKSPDDVDQAVVGIIRACALSLSDDFGLEPTSRKAMDVGVHRVLLRQVWSLLTPSLRAQAVELTTTEMLDTLRGQWGKNKEKDKDGNRK